MVEDKKVEVVEKKSQRQLEIEELRRVRVPAGTPRSNLNFKAREGYKRRVVMDKPGRLQEFYERGWRFVKADDITIEDKNVEGLLKASTRQGIDGTASQVIGSHKGGTPAIGYLMELPDELYEEDQQHKAVKVDALEDSLRQGMDADGGGSGDGRYVPKHTGIKIESPANKRR
jgi:hypothetical protein